MKSILSLLCLLLALSGFSQNQQKSSKNKRQTIDKTYSPDSNKDLASQKNADTTGTKNALSVAELFVIGKQTYQENYTPFKGHSRGFHVGFMNFANLPDEYDAIKLKGAGSFTFQFNIFNHNIGLNKCNNIGLITGLGLEYQRFRFKSPDYTISKTEGTTTIIAAKDRYNDIEKVKRNSFKNLYLTIPLMLEVQFPSSKHIGKRMYASAGFMGGIRMHSKTKIVYDNQDNDKKKGKDKGDFNTVPFKVDAIARIGYNNLSLWGGYTITNLFKDKNLTNLNVYTIGFGINI